MATYARKQNRESGEAWLISQRHNGSSGPHLAVCTLREVADCSPEIIALVTRGESALLSCWTASLPLICLTGHGSVPVPCFHVSVATMLVISREGRLPVPWLLSLWLREGGAVEHAHGAFRAGSGGGGSQRWGLPLKPQPSQLILPVKVRPKFCKAINWRTECKRQA